MALNEVTGSTPVGPVAASVARRTAVGSGVLLSRDEHSSEALRPEPEDVAPQSG